MKPMTQAECDVANTLREYEAAHAIWMNTSVYTDEGKTAKENKDKARKAYERALAILESQQQHRPQPYCTECGGQHEPSGARVDCVKFWKQRAVAATELVEWARTILCSATPNEKFLGPEQSEQWAKAFGKWFAESHTIPLLSHDWGCAKDMTDWLGETYRVVMHRHDGTWRAVDESAHKSVDADTMPLLCDALINWPEQAKSY